MKKILWVSKHQPLYSQVIELQRIFGQDVLIDVFEQAFAKAAVIVAKYRSGSYDELVVIATLSICRSIVMFGLKPLYAEMEQVAPDSPMAELELNGINNVDGRKRYYRFVKFRRIERVEIVFSELDS